MNEYTLQKNHIEFKYERKEGTESSYYLKEGESNILPERLSFTRSGFTEITYKGRARTENKIGQIGGQFKKNDHSPYKKFQPYRIFSSVWEAKGFPEFLGYGDIGFSNSKGKTQTSQDLFIISLSESDSLEIHLFKGLIQMKEEALSYIAKKKGNLGKDPL